MDHDVVAHLHLVAEGELDVLEAFEVLAAARKNPWRQDAAELDAEVHVLAAERRTVERIPEPEQRLHPGELLDVHLGVILGLERDVARIEAEQRGAGRERRRGIVTKTV